MKISPRFMGFMYFIIGILFTTMAVQSAGQTIWKFSTILFMVMATLDFGVALRIMFARRPAKKR